MLMAVISWIILGALAGWIATLVTSSEREVNGAMYVVVGIIGAFIGGLVLQLFGVSTSGGFSLASLLTAILGAVILLSLIQAFRRSRI